MQPTPTTPESEPRERSDRDLPALLQRSAEPVVVESYFAGWEKPWRALTGEAWREIGREFGERVNGARVETAANRETAERFGLEVIPTVLVFLAGNVVARFTGRVRAEEVIAAVRTALREALTRDAAVLELESVSAARDTLSPARSVLRRRASEPELTLARAG